MFARPPFAHVFHFDGPRLRASFSPRKPRHPLLRVAFGLVGVVVLAVLVFFGLFVGAAMVATGLLYRLWRQYVTRPQRDSRIVDGEYRVVGKPAPPRLR